MTPASSRPRPRASLALLTYNQETTVTQAALSCLGQIGEPIEIIFSDDASTDTTWDLLVSIASTYSGPHELRLRRSPTNLGIGMHYNAIIEQAQGALVITAAGDDISFPNRVSELLAAWDVHGQIPNLISSYLVSMTPEGQESETLQVDDLSLWNSTEQWLAKRPYVIGAAHAFTKRLHQQFGGFIPGLNYEDQIMAFRAASIGGGVTVKKPLLNYRQGGLSSKGSERSRAQILRRHRNHYYFYLQLKSDLKRIAHPWPWRFEWRLVRSAAFLALAGEDGTRTVSGPQWMRCLASLEAFLMLRLYRKQTHA